MDASSLPCPKQWRKPDGTPHREGNPLGSARTVDVDGALGLLLPSRQTARAAAVVLILVGAGLAALSGLLLAGDGVIAVLGGVVLGLLGVLLLAAGLFALVRSRSRKVGIVLTPDHVVLNWVRPAVRLPWDGVREIRPLVLRMGRSGASPTRHYVGVVADDPALVGPRMRKVGARFGPDVACAVAMSSVDVDQLVVLHTLRFYRDNPDARAELAGEAAVVRVRERRLRASE